MSLKSSAAIAIVSLVVLGPLLLSGPRPGVAAEKPFAGISFDCDPAQLHGALKLLCLARRFEEGRRLFDEETFGGNGRTCVTCHSVETGTFSPRDARRRLAANAGDPL